MTEDGATAIHQAGFFHHLITLSMNCEPVVLLRVGTGSSHDENLSYFVFSQSANLAKQARLHFMGLLVSSIWKMGKGGGI